MSNKFKTFFYLVVISVFLISSLSVFADITDQKQEKSQVEQSKNQKKKKKSDKNQDEQVNTKLHKEIIVTATRSEKTVFDVPKPVSVVNQEKIENRAPNNVSELLPELPGTDMVGVGANQSRPVIRGMRGQRILMLTDGIRMSNSRRTQTFGEIPSMIDVFGIERVEVVRGPASVLYGSEAIGGVMNIINRYPDYDRDGSNFTGRFGYRFGSADEQHKGFGSVSGNIGRLGFMISGTYRNSQNYMAPSGTFGDITLGQNTIVNDSGVQDDNINLFFGYHFSDGSDLSFKFDNYHAKDAGFGYVDPNEYSPGDPVIQLLYPKQKVGKLTLKYENRSLNFLLANGMTLTGYYMKNSRNFDTNIGIVPFPGATINVLSSNYTNVDTFGTRLEMTKILFKDQVLTYGLDFLQDDSQNTDKNVTEMSMFGMTMREIDEIPKVPNAYFRSFGLFAQDEIYLFKRFLLTLGLRYQNVHAQSKETLGLVDPLIKSTDSTLVGAMNFMFDITEDFKFMASLGRGFRSSNLPERFYEGITPDGAGYQIKNPDLKPETSFNVDLGLRYRIGNFYIESTYFRNMVYDGIQIQLTGLRQGRLLEYQNINVDKLRIQGVEVLSFINFDFGVSVTGSYSRLSSKNLNNPELMYADTYGSRMNLNVRYTFPNDLFWTEYHIRHNGDRKDIDLGNNPIGSIIPGFTVHSLRVGVTLFKNSAFPQQVGFVFNNLTNRLYSEFSNASFFRPAPKRNVVFTWISRF